MKRSNTLRIILIVILAALIVASIGLYVADLIINGTPPADNLFKALAVAFSCALSIIRIAPDKMSRNAKNSLADYESAYSEHISEAFTDRPFYKKKLLCAIRLYNENNYNKALKYLVQLKAVAKTRGDIYAVGLITALTLTDAEYYDDAILVYNTLIEMNITSSTIYGNLGNVHLNLGNRQEAIKYIQLAIQKDENKAAPYNNLASLYFETSDFENAKIYAKKALDINHKMYQASTLLAIIYTLEGDKENADKYSHMAIAGGRAPAELDEILEYYTSKKEQDDEEEEEE